MKYISVLFCILTASISLSANAGDVKNYLASSCEVDDAYAGYSSSYRYSKYFGYIENTSPTDTLHVTCPLVRDDTTSGNTASNGWIRVRDYHSSKNVKCTFYRVYSSGNIASGNVRYSSGSSWTVQKLNFSNLSQGPAEDTMHMLCEIPPMDSGRRSGVFSYSTDEL